MIFRINRSPEAGEASTGAAEESAKAGGEGAAPQYVGKAEFDSFRSELSQQFARLTPQERREENRNVSRETESPKEPNPKDYKFDQPGELTRYNRDNYKWLRSEERAVEDKENSTRQGQEQLRTNERAHNTRVMDYRKEHPEFDEDMKTAGPIQVLDQVKAAIFRSKASHEILHYMAKNRGTDQELNMLLESEGPEAMLERLGEIRASVKHESTVATANTTAAKAKPLRVNVNRSASTDGGKKDYTKIFDTYSKA
jgi:hypothetical protein